MSYLVPAIRTNGCLNILEGEELLTTDLQAVQVIVNQRSEIIVLQPDGRLLRLSQEVAGSVIVDQVGKYHVSVIDVGVSRISKSSNYLIYLLESGHLISYNSAHQFYRYTTEPIIGISDRTAWSAKRIYRYAQDRIIASAEYPVPGRESETIILNDGSMLLDDDIYASMIVVNQEGFELKYYKQANPVGKIVKCSLEIESWVLAADGNLYIGLGRQGNAVHPVTTGVIDYYLHDVDDSHSLFEINSQNQLSLNGRIIGEEVARLPGSAPFYPERPAWTKKRTAR